MSTEPPGRLIASGRAADVYDLGDGTVLRRYRTGHDAEPEARLMRWLVDRGIPVPIVHAADGPDVLMERVDGPTMLDDLGRRPWQVVSHARLLARLQADINRLEAPGWLPSVGDGGRVLHLDLHPMNVMLPPSGPMVIDWTNARSGPPELDAATSHVLMASFEASGAVERIGRAILVRTFRWSRGRRLIDDGLTAAIDRRLADANITPGEATTLQQWRDRSAT